MRLDLSLRLVAAMTLMLAACGGGEPFSELESESDFGSPVTGSGEEAAAMLSVNDALTLQGMTGDTEVGESSVTFFSNAANVPLQLVNSAFVTQRQLELATDVYRQTLERAAAGQVLVPAAGFPDCVEASVGAVRFNDCQVMTDTTTTTMNGLVEVVDGRILADIQVDASFSDGDTTLNMTTNVSADVAVTETHIGGRVDVHARVSIPGTGSATQDSAAIYDVELDENGCAVGGELRVGVQQKASAGGRTQKLRAVGRAVFGPACGDVTVYARQD